MGSFDPVKFDQFPVGAVLQSPINLETATNGKWIALDGRDCNRSDYPELAPYFPAGVFTSTARTLNSAPANAVIATDGTNFVAAGAAGANPIQASSDGITWVTGLATSSTVNSLIVAGSRFIAAGSTGIASPIVYATGNAAANTGARDNWTATTGGTTTTLTQGLAYSPSLGRTVLIPNGAGTTIYTLEDGATAWTSRTHTTSRSKQSVLWTGQRFVCFIDANVILVSNDGITWSEEYPKIPLVVNFNLPSQQTDGRGTIVSLISNDVISYAVVSKDHGRNWRRVLMPADYLATGLESAGAGFKYLTYANGLFIATGTVGAGQNAISADGLTWTNDSLYYRGSLTGTGTNTALAFKSGVYVLLRSGSTAAMSFTEDKSKFALMASVRTGNSTNTNATYTSHQEYIKARS